MLYHHIILSVLERQDEVITRKPKREETEMIFDIILILG